MAAVISLGACLALPVRADDETAQAAIRTFEIRIVQMIAYTMVSLWILAQPIVETTPGGVK